MGTHDEETSKYFKNTRVNCILFPREASHAQDSMVGRNTADRIFTHHQKTVRRNLASSLDKVQQYQLENSMMAGNTADRIMHYQTTVRRIPGVPFMRGQGL